jgi:hypothetical protein
LRHGNAERLGGLEIDDQLQDARLLHRQIGRLGARENPADIGSSLAKDSREARSIADQPASHSEFMLRVDRGNGIARRQRHGLLAPTAEGRVAGDKESTGIQLDEGGKRAVNRINAEGLAMPLPVLSRAPPVLTRPEHLAAAGATVEQITALLDALFAVCRPVEISFLWRPMLRDADDEMVLEAAVNGRADRLLTFNERDQPARRNGRATRPGLAVMEEGMTQANYALRLQASIKAEAERLAKAEGTTLNQFINVAVAEKIAALRIADFFRERARRANLPDALALLDQLGRDEPPRSGDELE